MDERKIYKQYFDQIQPDQKLVDATKKMMQEELNREVSPDRHSIFKVNKYLALTACAAVAAASVLIIPKLRGDVPVSDPQTSQIVSDTLSSQDSTSESTPAHHTTINAAAQSSELNLNSDHEANEKQTSAGTDKSVGTVRPSATDKPVSGAGTDNNHQEITKAPQHAVSPVQSAYHTDAQTQQSTQKNEISISTVQTNAASSETPKETATPSASHTAAGTVVTTVTSNGKPHATAPNDGNETTTAHDAAQPDSDMTTTANVLDGINNASAYKRNVPNLGEQVTYKDCADHFGFDVIPQCLKDLDPEATGTIEQGYYEYKTGAVFTYGTPGKLSSSKTKFISVTVSDADYVRENGADDLLGYKFYCDSPVRTQIGDKDCIIGRYMTQSSSCAFFCEFEKNGVYYSLSVNNYSLAYLKEIVDAI